MIVNGQQRTARPGATVADLVRELSRDEARRGLAVAVNGEVVPRSEWDRRALDDDDRVEVLSAIGGG